MFSASRLFAKYVGSPKNGPVPNQGVNGYVGATSDVFKVRIGRFQQRRRIFVKGHRLLSRLLPLAASWYTDP
jgi:hypothetical protein